MLTNIIQLILYSLADIIINNTVIILLPTILHTLLSAFRVLIISTALCVLIHQSNTECPAHGQLFTDPEIPCIYKRHNSGDYQSPYI